MKRFYPLGVILIVSMLFGLIGAWLPAQPSGKYTIQDAARDEVKSRGVKLPLTDRQKRDGWTVGELYGVEFPRRPPPAKRMAMAQPEPPADVEVLTPAPDQHEDAPAPADAPPVPMPQLALVLPGRVLSIHDGDTLKIECRIVFNCRLLSCWAPEVTGKEKPKGLKSKANLEKLANGKACIVTIPWQDDIGKMTSMGRILGKVSVNGDDLSYMQTSKGFATKAKIED